MDPTSGLTELSPLSPQAKYISTCIDEIKQELKQDNIAVKANAVCKLTYVRPPRTALLYVHHSQPHRPETLDPPCRPVI